MKSEGGQSERPIFDCVVIGGCGEKDIHLLDTDEGVFCGNCGGEAAMRGGPTELDLFREAMRDSSG